MNTHPQYLEFVGERKTSFLAKIDSKKTEVKEQMKARANYMKTHFDLKDIGGINFTAKVLMKELKELETDLSAWLAIHDGLVRHEPEIRYALDEGGGSFDSEQELLDSFTEQELKESPPGITTFIICSACGELNTEIQENADEWVYLPEVYFPCPSYLDITKHLDKVMG
jgi:hypothetical protein